MHDPAPFARWRRPSIFWIQDFDKARVRNDVETGGFFTLDGEYVDQIVWRTKRFARALALSPDPEQRFLYTGGGSGIAVLDRHTLEVLTTIDDNYIAPDAQPGRPRGFRGMAGGGHHIRADSQGNLYIAGPGARLQRLLFMGLSSTE